MHAVTILFGPVRDMPVMRGQDGQRGVVPEDEFGQCHRAGEPVERIRAAKEFIDQHESRLTGAHRLEHELDAFQFGRESGFALFQ